LPKCLKAILKNNLEEAEILVINDHSTDNSSGIALEMGVVTIENPRGRGPAAARNFGAEKANGQILFFVDSDVVVKENTVWEVQRIFDQNPEIAAIFGSYDDQPGSLNFLSQYKNLFHHFIHQHSKEEASTFWAGCGAIRKDVFKSLGGFNENEYKNASIEDIELGVRMWNLRLPVRLEKSIQAKHLKRWTPIGLLKADILYRAIPWSKLILQNRRIPFELNLLPSHRLSALLVGLLILLLLLLTTGYFWLNLPSTTLYILLLVMSVIFLLLIFLNRKLYGFFLARRGFLFTLGVIWWHFFYYFYSGATFCFCWLYYKFRSLGTGARASLPADHGDTI
jgi:glycosyltransferase involved in cell wall biosynthesis